MKILTWAPKLVTSESYSHYFIILSSYQLFEKNINRCNWIHLFCHSCYFCNCRI